MSSLENCVSRGLRIERFDRISGVSSFTSIVAAIIVESYPMARGEQWQNAHSVIIHIRHMFTR